ncbi:hypothetical protein AB6A40_003370 [Gnathostoma spinigerum]|uniref:Signal recognition particle 19 kDa protein n=1 Tax=Gnathostoma spinigerum TaxID=75299 RepID=A0ABD6EH02_9BILA
MSNPYKLKSLSDESRWICIYPLYMNARRTIKQGRRVSKEKAVDLPTSQEIYDILVNVGMNAKIEKTKMHPLDPNRDTNLQGRVRVQLHNEDGSLFNPRFPTRMSLMYYACEMIPKLKTRQGGGQSAGAGTSIAGAGGGGGKSKKNRRR